MIPDSQSGVQGNNAHFERKDLTGEHNDLMYILSFFVLANILPIFSKKKSHFPHLIILKIIERLFWLSSTSLETLRQGPHNTALGVWCLHALLRNSEC